MKNKESKIPYIKPTRKMHDSGFRMVEYGYLIGENGKDKEVLGEYDVFFGDRDNKMHIDVTRDGYIRFLMPLKWSKFTGRLESTETEGDL